MHFRPLFAAAAIATAVTAAVPVGAQETGLEKSIRALQRIATQYTVLFARMLRRHDL